MWTKNSLADYFSNNKISPDVYSLLGQKENAFCIDCENDLWFVFYIERGVRTNLGSAESESKALNILKLFVMESERGFKKVDDKIF